MPQYVVVEMASADPTYPFLSGSPAKVIGSFVVPSIEGDSMREIISTFEPQDDQALRTFRMVFELRPVELLGSLRERLVTS